MNRFVYLFELDSVRNSLKEIAIGQRALFDEIVTNGNCVVVTFNQLTDSVAFMRLIDDEKSYASILELFRLGAIKVSQYGKNTTASKYMQVQVNKCLGRIDEAVAKISARLYADQLRRNSFADEWIYDEAAVAAEETTKGRFCFSGLPIRSTDRKLLLLIREALENSDPSILDRAVAKMAPKSEKLDEEGLKAWKDMRLISRFVRLVLAISVENEVHHSPKEQKGKPFLTFLHEIFALPEEMLREFAAGRTDCEAITLLPSALSLLREKERQIDERMIQNRSDWIDVIPREPDPRSALAEMVVDLCYNFAVEDSIRGVAKHYLDSEDKRFFHRVFLCRLVDYWKLFRDGDHKIYTETEYVTDVSTSVLPWKKAARIRTAPKLIGFSKRRGSRRAGQRALQTSYIGLYEYGLSREKSRWERENLGKFLLIILTALLYILVFCLLNYFLGQAQTSAGLLWPAVAAVFANSFFLQAIVMTAAFGIVGSVLAKILKLPDVLDSIRSIWNGFVDLLATLKRPRPSFCPVKEIAEYRQVREADVRIPVPVPVPPAAAPLRDMPQPDVTDAWRAYQELMRSRPELFTASDLIDIVTDRRIVGRFEGATGKKIGVVYQSGYHLFVVDLIADPRDGYKTYERIVPAVPRGAVVILPVYDKKMVLLKQYRHALRDYEYSFPRGFGEKNQTPEDNARKEISEELRTKVLSTVFLGTTVADSGLSGNEVSVFLCEIEEPKDASGHEGITEVLLLTETEIRAWIRGGRIRDGFTLSAFSLYQNMDRNIQRSES